jgi:hydroxymethylpyrimidine/phosphomethylpyrimidine kinase
LGKSCSLDRLEDVVTGAHELLKVGCGAVLLKGGHLASNIEDVLSVEKKHTNIKITQQNLPGENMEILYGSTQTDLSNMQLVVDVLHQRSGQTTMFVRPRIESSSTHGTGCTLSSSIASELAKGASCTFCLRLHHGCFLILEKWKRL